MRIVQAPTESPSSVLELPRRTRIAARVGAAVAGTSRLLGRGGGSVIGGRVILALDPLAVHRMSQGRPIALVSGTNGKTTTTRLLTAALAVEGPVLSNLQGANLPPGLVAVMSGAPSGTSAVLEVDEAWLARVVAATAPKVVVLLNLSRDQLDRNNEVRHLSSMWRQVLSSSDSTVVANADDPLVAWGAGGAASVRWVAAGQPWTSDATGCPSCGGRVVFAEPGTHAITGTLGSSGGWACDGCGFSRPEPHAWIEGGEIESGEIVFCTGERHPLGLSLPGRANRANAAMAVSAAQVLGVKPADAIEAIREVHEVSGRYATFDVDGIGARLLLAKNPAGWLEVFDLLRPPPLPVVVAINARVADGKDPSWLWDVDFERLRGRFVVATGERGRDLAVRLRYAEVDHVYVPDLVAAIRATERQQVDVVANYTSFQQLRIRLS